MSTLSVAELQAQVETDLGSTTLQQIIDSVERDITEYVGPTTGYVYESDGDEYSELIRLPAEALTITTVVEYTDAVHEPTKTTLAADDYELSSDKWWLRRVSDGTNTRATWGWHVVITFVPATDTNRRKQAAVQLARLEIVHTGYKSERIGDWTSQNADYEREKVRILNSLDLTLVD